MFRNQGAGRENKTDIAVSGSLQENVFVLVGTICLLSSKEYSLFPKIREMLTMHTQ